MKKIATLLLLVCLGVGLTACQKSTGNQDLKMNLTDIMDALYKDVPADQLPALEKTKINPENFSRFLGDSQIDYQEALASEPMISSIAHSVVLVRLEDNADVEAAKKELLEHVDPRKWICVGVEKEDMIIENRGSLILVVIVDNPDTRKIVANTFLKLEG